MKNYRVTVNGTAYDVVVEELASGSVSAPAPAPTPVKAAQPAAAPAPAPAPAAAPADGFKLLSPMPGVIVGINVNVGDTVTKNQGVMVLEAMKMENEISIPVAGKVLAINVTKGASVNTGDLLLVVQE